MKERTYIAIDLKSFYASVECVDRGLDPLDTNLVVADKSRTEKTICLAVTPALKSYGVSGRARLFEVVQKVRGSTANAAGMLRTGSLQASRILTANLKPTHRSNLVTLSPRPVWRTTLNTARRFIRFICNTPHPTTFTSIR